MATEPIRLWGGRFAKPPAAELLALSSSALRHWRLAAYDLMGSVAHAHELADAGILGTDELERLVAGIQALADDVVAGRFVPDPADEDVHTALERALLERLGPLGGKLRAGRSRNDQAATDLRLYLRDAARETAQQLVGLCEALMTQAQAHLDTPAPGFTHLQPAQPISFAHQLLAHVQPLLRDLDRLRDWDDRAAVSPLGAGALAGSAIVVHPERMAERLGFTGSFANSVDAVADRDYAAEYLFVTALIGVHISRLAEEVVLWSSRQFGWILLDDAYATGSSIMPQKKNPDIAELTRGGSGVLIGDLTGLLALLKSLPLAYNRDMSQDKQLVFDAVDTLAVGLPAMTGLIATMTVVPERLEADSEDGFTLATEAADWLVRRGVPFRDAHEIAGRMVSHCERVGKRLGELDADELIGIDPALTPDVLDVLTVRGALAARTGAGGTAPHRVTEQLAAARAACSGYAGWTRR